jgi:hypothetical protein
MARLIVEANARWSGGVADFNLFPIYVVVSVSHADGSPVPSLAQSAFVVRFLQDPDRDSLSGAITAFRETSSGGPTGAQGYYSFVVKPSAEGAGSTFVTDDVFVLVTVRGGGNHGQTLCFVRYRLL